MNKRVLFLLITMLFTGFLIAHETQTIGSQKTNQYIISFKTSSNLNQDAMSGVATIPDQSYVAAGWNDALTTQAISVQGILTNDAMSMTSLAPAVVCQMEQSLTETCSANTKRFAQDKFLNCNALVPTTMTSAARSSARQYKGAESMVGTSSSSLNEVRLQQEIKPNFNSKALVNGNSSEMITRKLELAQTTLECC